MGRILSLEKAERGVKGGKKKREGSDEESH
jgi:hypothetical protein